MCVYFLHVQSHTISTHSRSSNTILPLFSKTDMGQDAKKRLQLFAAQWNTGLNKLASKFAGHNNNAAATQENAGAANETRGLLDSDDGEEMEMSFSKTKNQ